MPSTFRPYQEPAVTTLVSGDKLLVDSAVRGTGAMDFDALSAQFQLVSGKAAASGYASLDSTGKVPATQLRSPYTIESVANAAARNALTVITAEIAVRQVRLTDTGVIYVPNAAGTGSGIWVEFNSVGTASTGAAGVVQLATNAEAVTGTDALKSITPSTLQAGVAQLRNGLAPAQGLAFAGGQDAAVANVPASPDYFSIFMWVKLDETLADSGLWSGTAGFGVVTGSNQLQVNGGSAYYTATNGSALNEWACVGYTKSLTVGTFWLNGKSNGVVSDTDAWSGALVTSFNKRTFADGKKTISRPFIYNRALSAAEVLALYESSAPVAADYNGLTGANSITAVNGPTYPFATFSGASSSGFTAGDTTTGGAYVTVTPSLTINKGQKIKVTFSAVANSGSIGDMRIRIVSAGYTASYSNAETLVSGSNSVELTATDYATDATVKFWHPNGNPAVDFTISSLAVNVLGLLLAPDSAQVGGGLAWYDTSGNAANITLPATGVSWSLPTSGKALSLSLASTTAGSAGAGALVVQGGISAGNTGSAASYFGGNLLVGSATTLGTASPTAISVVGRLRSYQGSASVANTAYVDVPLTMPRGLVAYFAMSSGNSAHQSAGFFRANDNGASTNYTLFGQSEASIAVTVPSAGNIRITNNTGGTETITYTFTMIAGQ